MPRIVETDRALIEHLHELVFNLPEFGGQVGVHIKTAYARFDDPSYTLPYSSENIEVGRFIEAFPDDCRGRVKLCRVFVLRQGRRMPHPEIHRNSVQRLVSFWGEGVVYCAAPGGADKNFAAHRLVSPGGVEVVDLDESWDVVPANTWHFPEAGRHSDWITVTFHSAGAEEIIDAYADEGT